MYFVVIADDEKLMREGLARSIPWNNLGFSVAGIAASADEAVSFFQSKEIHLLLTDVRMPGKSGIDLLGWVKRYSPASKVIVISGYDKFEYAQNALKLGADDYILKPIKKTMVIESVKRMKKALDAYYSQMHLHNLYQRDFFFRKLLENPLVSTDELEEIKMRLECTDESGHYAVFLFDFYGIESKKTTLSARMNDFLWDEIGIYTVVIVPDQAIERFEKDVQSLAIPWAKGSEQTFDSLCISYENALDVIRHDEGKIYHTFHASFVEYRKIMKLLDALSVGDYVFVDDYLSQLFSHFDNTTTAKKWCLWFMDCLEQSFEKYRFTGQYQMAVKNCQSQDISVLHEIFIQYMKKVYMTLEERKLSASGQLVQRAKTLIDGNLSDKNISLTTISLELQISYGYLSGVFKREEGQSFSSYLVRRRMEKAAELLSRHDMKLYEVADACGYGNYRYFSDSFRKYWGRIPSEFQGV